MKELSKVYETINKMKELSSELSESHLLYLYQNISNIPLEDVLRIEYNIKQILEVLDNVRKGIDIISFNKMLQMDVKKTEVDDYVCERVSVKTPKYDRKRMEEVLLQHGYKKDDFINGYTEKNYVKFMKKKKK